MMAMSSRSPNILFMRGIPKASVFCEEQRVAATLVRHGMSPNSRLESFQKRRFEER